jgi:hypothetical protein
MSSAMLGLSRWARTSPSTAEGVAFNAVRTIVSLAPGQGDGRGDSGDDGAPYSIIALFLCHVVLWVYASVSTEAEKRRLVGIVDVVEGLRGSEFVEVLKRALEERGEPKVLFKSAAEMLTKLGTWGAALNLALLIHKRAEMQ